MLISYLGQYSDILLSCQNFCLLSIHVEYRILIRLLLYELCIRRGHTNIFCKVYKTHRILCNIIRICCQIDI